MFREELLHDLLHHKKISRVEQLLFVLACNVNEVKQTKQVRDIAFSAGLREVKNKKWNISAILGRDAAGLVVNTKEGWKLNSKGKEKVSQLLTENNVQIKTIDDEQFSLSNLLHPTIKENAFQHYLDGHLRDSVLNAIIAVFDFIREKTGVAEDGDKLIGKVFSVKDPYLILSNIDSDSGVNDQTGFLQIYNGAFKGIRNPKAHTLNHDLTGFKAAQYLVFASLLARRVDEAKLVKHD